MPSRREETGIFERPKGSGIWWAEINTKDGHRPKKKCGSKQAARDWRDDMKSDDRRDRLEPRKKKAERPSFAELADRCMAIRKGQVAETTYKSNLERLGPLKRELGHKLVDELSVELLGRVLARLRENPGGRARAGGTINRYRSMLSSIFSYGLEIGVMTSNPLWRSSRNKSLAPYREPEDRNRWLTAAEEALLREEITGRYGKYPRRMLGFELALYTGMRQGEQWSLAWTDVHFEQLVIRIRISKSGPHAVPISPECLRTLRALYDLRHGSCYVYRGEAMKRGEAAPKDRSTWFATCLRKAGIGDFSWHDLRHSFASRAVMKGASLYAVQQILGHSTPRMTQRYAHLVPGYLHQQMAMATSAWEDFPQAPTATGSPCARAASTVKGKTNEPGNEPRKVVVFPRRLESAG